MTDAYDDDMDGGSGKGRGKSRRELPTGAVATLKAWLLSPEHFTHPYPTPQDQAMLMQKTGIDKKQLKNWFTNARRRIWKPMLKKQIEQGKLAGAAPGAGLMIPGMQGAGAAAGSMDNPHSVQAMRVHYQQAMQGQDHAQVPAATDTYGSVVYSGQSSTNSQGHFYASNSDGAQLATSSSIGTLAQVSSSAQLSKTDSHAVLMELFARDQDLVRQATESARLKAETQHQAPASQAPATSTSQHPMTKAPAGALQSVPTLNSWPQFSSITSLNNLGTIPGVKSISSMSGQDLAGKGSVNNMGNLAQLKSMESMGKNDSYAFLEVFFGGNSSSNLSSMGGAKGASSKHGAGDEDNEIGLSLEDESPSHTIKKEFVQHAPIPTTYASSASLNTSTMGQQESGSSVDPGTLKRAYDDAMAARGLMSVSRSCEKLTDLVLPTKIQRTLSQEFVNKSQQQSYSSYQQQQQTENKSTSTPSSHQYPGEQPTEPQTSGSTSHSGHVQVSSAAACVLCSQTNVDTQLRPCGHMFHERCLKPSLSNPNGAPKCPVDDIPISSALLALPEPTLQASASSQSLPRIEADAS